MSWKGCCLGFLTPKSPLTSPFAAKDKERQGGNLNKLGPCSSENLVQSQHQGPMANSTPGVYSNVIHSSSCLSVRNGDTTHIPLYLRPQSLLTGVREPSQHLGASPLHPIPLQAGTSLDEPQYWLFRGFKAWLSSVTYLLCGLWLVLASGTISPPLQNKQRG